MWRKLNRMASERVRSEGYTEGRVEAIAETNAEWNAWLARRTASGTFVPDDDDPPPGSKS